MQWKDEKAISVKLSQKDYESLKRVQAKWYLKNKEDLPIRAIVGKLAEYWEKHNE